MTSNLEVRRNALKKLEQAFVSKRTVSLSPTLLIRLSRLSSASVLYRHSRSWSLSTQKMTASSQWNSEASDLLACQSPTNRL